MSEERIFSLHSAEVEELTQIEELVRRFAARFNTRFDYQREDFEAMGGLGLTGLSVSEAAGGQSLPPIYTAVTLFELSRKNLGAAIYLSVHLMVAKLLEQFGAEHSLTNSLAHGKALGAFCLTEANAGSDAAQLRTKAVRDGADWILHGEKIYITMGGLADLYLVFARTGSDDSKGISAFVVPKDTPGLSFGVPEQKMGCEGSPIATLSFDQCRIPGSALLGAEGNGYKIALSGLAGGRVNIGACACGLATEAIERTRTYTLERNQFGQPIADFQGIQFMLADMAMKLRASILLTRDAANGSTLNAWRASMAKCFATDSAMSITTDCVQLFGGAGYLRDYRVEQLMRDAKMLQIVEGTNQIQRVLIARALLEASPHRVGVLRQADGVGE